MCQLLTDLLSDDGYSVEVANDGDTALEKFQFGAFGLTVTDLMMPKMKGTELVRRLREIDDQALVLLITAFGTIESAVEAMRAGAFHYVTKPFHNDEILIQVKRLWNNQRFAPKSKLRVEVQARDRFQNIIGQSEAMQRVLDIPRRSLTCLPTY